MEWEQLMEAALAARGHEEWLGQLWLERVRVLRAVTSRRRTVAQEFARLAQKVGRRPATLIPVDPKELDTWNL